MRNYIENKIFNNHLLYREIDPLNPLNLPPNTIRLQFIEGFTPQPEEGTIIRISENPNIWDFTYNNNNWDDCFEYSYITDVLGANTTNVTSMNNMFTWGLDLSSVALFDTSNATSMSGMFYKCAITSIPPYNTDKVQNVDSMFSRCFDVDSGIVDFYNQLNTQAIPPTSHSGTFYLCGRDSQTGSAELAQIPASWK